jgi:hypothetical protein
MRYAFLFAAAVALPGMAAAETRLKPLVDTRLRYEQVDQAGLARDAEALTARARVGVEATHGPFSLLGEAESTFAFIQQYNSGTNLRTRFSVVADPQNVELNRLQLQYRPTASISFTGGRQRVNMDDQRFVGAAGWRQNEQTFDAVRLEAKKLGPISLDVAYAWSVRTIYGIEAGELPANAANKQAIGGDNVFASADSALGPVSVRTFAYLVDQDEPGRRQFSSQTYGLRIGAALPLGGKTKLDLAASWARQSDWKSNPLVYHADYWLAEARMPVAGFALTAGYEVLGAGTGGSVQTPLATLHKFNGWADKFLVTPANGLRDLYVGAARPFPALKALPGLNAALVWHRFNSDRQSRAYGREWDAQLGFRLGRTALLVKYADYRRAGAADFAGDADTKKLWLQLEWTI